MLQIAGLLLLLFFVFVRHARESADMLRVSLLLTSVSFVVSVVVEGRYVSTTAATATVSAATARLSLLLLLLIHVRSGIGAPLGVRFVARIVLTAVLRVELLLLLLPTVAAVVLLFFLVFIFAHEETPLRVLAVRGKSVLRIRGQLRRGGVR